MLTSASFKILWKRRRGIACRRICKWYSYSRRGIWLLKWNLTMHCSNCEKSWLSLHHRLRISFEAGITYNTWIMFTFYGRNACDIRRKDTTRNGSGVLNVPRTEIKITRSSYYFVLIAGCAHRRAVLLLAILRNGLTMSHRITTLGKNQVALTGCWVVWWWCCCCYFFCSSLHTLLIRRFQFQQWPLQPYLLIGI